MKFQTRLLSNLLLVGTGSICSINSAIAEEGWQVKPYFGLSTMSDMRPQTTDIGATNGSADVDLETGFTAGLGFLYQYNEHVAAEIAWEYRSNDSSSTLPDGSEFSEGNYASNLFMINGYYFLASPGQWKPYLGGGITWVQEIDIDLESNGIEESYSGEGDVGYQLFTGVIYQLSEILGVDAQVRYGSISGIDLEGEEGSLGRFSDIDYDTTTIQVGLSYSF